MIVAYTKTTVLSVRAHGRLVTYQPVRMRTKTDEERKREAQETAWGIRHISCIVTL